ncbi:hypothetical protein [Cytophaga hutchinsonii]|jgi:hypothetical protein|nr:hypothetical protein [Cytophaga hutchinsonii]SFX23188.1 hypothetical protein SAMN04487930_102156 [Cytophaga hutchinsonii ATCC 33406]
MKKLQSKKTKKSSARNTNQEKESNKIYVSDMGIGFRVVNFRALSV